MWQSATAAAVVTLHQQHLLLGGLGGLGGVIAAIAGGVVSVITLRNARRSVAPPAATPQPAPLSRRPATPRPGEPAPPTSPARRLHPGPVALSAPQRPRPEDDEAPVVTSLFDPDILSDAQPQPDEPANLLDIAGDSAPILRSSVSLRAEWRTQAAVASEPELPHAPIWNRSPFAHPARADEPHATHEAAEISLTIAPPLWRSMLTSEPAVEPYQPGVESAISLTASHAPVWPTWLNTSHAPTAHQSSAVSDEVETGAEPPIWQAPLRYE